MSDKVLNGRDLKIAHHHDCASRIIWEHWEEYLSRVAKLLINSWKISINPESLPKTIACMDDRLLKWTGIVSLAWSWILIVNDLIKQWLNWDEIISYLTPIFQWNNIQTMTSHQDCWAWKLFYNSLVEYFWIENKSDFESIIKKLETIFPWISEISFNWGNITISWKEDVITALVLKYISIKANLEYKHLQISHNSIDIPDHSSRSLILDLTDYDITWYCVKNHVNPWYVLDVSMLLDNSDLIERIILESIIAKSIASKQPWLTKEDNMVVSICFEKDNKKHIELIEKIISDINIFVENWHQELRWLYQIKRIPLPKVKK